MLLYKYGNLERLNILKNKLIRFTPVDEFNDPFEAPIPENENEK